MNMSTTEISAPSLPEHFNFGSDNGYDILHGLEKLSGMYIDGFFFSLALNLEFAELIGHAVTKQALIFSTICDKDSLTKPAADAISLIGNIERRSWSTASTATSLIMSLSGSIADVLAPNGHPQTVVDIGKLADTKAIAV